MPGILVGMDIMRGGGDAAVAQVIADHRQGNIAVNGGRAVGMAQPVGAGVLEFFGSFWLPVSQVFSRKREGLFKDFVQGQRGQRLAFRTTQRWDQRVIG